MKVESAFIKLTTYEHGASFYIRPQEIRSAEQGAKFTVVFQHGWRTNVTEKAEDIIPLLGEAVYAITVAGPVRVNLEEK